MMMKKILKISAIVILLLIVVIIAIPFLFKGKILTKVQETINKEVNAKVEFKDVNLSMFSNFPKLTVGLEELSVVGIEKFANDTLVKFESFDVAVDLFSAFGDEISIKSISLKKPYINIIVLEDGAANYDIAKPSEEKTEESEPTEFKMALQKFEIVDAHIIYNDKPTNVYTELDGFNYNMKGDFTASTTDLENDFSIDAFTVIYDNISYLNKVKIEAEADLFADLDKFEFTLKENVFKLNALTFGIDGTFGMPGDDMNFDMSYYTKKAAFKHFLSLIPAIYSQDFAGLTASGTLEVKGTLKGTLNDTSLPGFTTAIKIENGNFKYPDLPKSVDNVNVAINVENSGGTGDNMTIDISKFHVEMANNPFDVAMFIRTTAADVDVKGDFTGTIDFGSVGEFVPLDSMKLAGIVKSNIVIDGKLSSIENEKYEEFKADGTLQLNDFYFENVDFPQGAKIPSALISFSPQFVNLSNFIFQSGTSDVKMTGRLENFIAYALTDTAVVKGNLEVSSMNFNANEFMSESSETVEDTTAVTAFEVPGNIDFKLQSNFDKVLYDNMTISKINGLLIIKDQKVDMQNLSMNLLKGSMRVNGSYDAKDYRNPLTDFMLDITDFDIQEAIKMFVSVKTLVPMADLCYGRVSAKLDIQTALDFYLNPVYDTFNGKGRLKSKQVKVEGSPFFKQLGAALKSDKFDNMTFDDLDIGFTIKEGKVTLEPFDTKVGNNKANISGTHGLDQTIDYQIKMQMPKSQLGDAATDVLNSLVKKAGDKGVSLNNSELANITAFVVGTTTDPKIKLGLTGDASAKETVKDAVKEQVVENVKDKAAEGLKEAKKQADDIMKKANAEADALKKSAQKAGEQLIAEADTQGKTLIKNAGNNIIKKRAAEKSAQIMNKEAKKKAEKLNDEAESKSKLILDNAQSRSDKIIADAEKKVQ